MSGIEGGFNINNMFNKIADSIQASGAELQKQMESIDPTKMDQQTMLKMQFQVGQYNAMLEAASTVTKSLVDEAKQIAQRAS